MVNISFVSHHYITHVSMWRKHLENSLVQNCIVHKDMSSMAYALSTIEDNTPRNRHVIHRGFLNELERIPKDNRCSADPSFPISDRILLTTTDVRSPKQTQINNGGSPFEIAWYFRTSIEQFRFRGSAYIYHPNLKPLPDNIYPEPLNQNDVNNSNKRFDFEAERDRIFKSVSPGVRAGLLRPWKPGTSLQTEDASKIKQLPQELPITDELDKQDLIDEAYANFALIILDVESVDYVDLGSTPNKRFEYKRHDEVRDNVPTSVVWEFNELSP